MTVHRKIKTFISLVILYDFSILFKTLNMIWNNLFWYQISIFISRLLLKLKLQIQRKIDIGKHQNNFLQIIQII